MVERKSPCPIRHDRESHCRPGDMDWPPIRDGQFDDESHGEKAERRETGAEPENEQHGEDDFSAAGQERPPSMVVSRKPAMTRERARAFSCLVPSEPLLFEPDFATAWSRHHPLDHADRRRHQVGSNIRSDQ
jgi:hypothetical protein